MGRAGKALVVTLGVTVMLPVVGFIHEEFAKARDRKRFPMHGRKFDVGGYGLHRGE